ncbi:dihydrofolate reductase [Hufsiella ginkgonis]|uniref:Dihydrofolate reductase n=1 Tax=Hufsiella ginkgonis TaxID=2695274 RepID=A0A7K1XXX5_9SPHI|nr:dihydrofolate reductase [Hufsiella ginkgonis]MXV15851.1 dihydrofolate reductase [Hufsiella ginkgonis]
MEVRIVVIADRENGIGRDNALLAHMPADLKHFKELTIGHPVIMGRKTFDSVGKPLPGRRNIVITTQDIEIAGAEVVHSLPEALELCGGTSHISVVGGATIYEQAIHVTDVIYLTRIHAVFEADTFFPAIDPHTWEETGRKDHEANEKNPFPYSFITYRRR